MPGGNGIGLLLEMKRNDQTLPIIVLTDYPYRQYQRQYVDTGADFFFDKSTEFNQMMAVLRRLGKNSDSDKTTSPRSRDAKINIRRKETKANEIFNHIKKQVYDSTRGRAKFD